MATHLSQSRVSILGQWQWRHLFTLFEYLSGIESLGDLQLTQSSLTYPLISLIFGIKAIEVRTLIIWAKSDVSLFISSPEWWLSLHSSWLFYFFKDQEKVKTYQAIGKRDISILVEKKKTHLMEVWFRESSLRLVRTCVDRCSHGSQDESGKRTWVILHSSLKFPVLNEPACEVITSSWGSVYACVVSATRKWLFA